MRKILTLLLCLIVVSPLCAQQSDSEPDIRGFVFERDARGDLQPLPGAHVFCIKDQQGAITDASGAFVLHTHNEFPHPITASFVGYEPDTINLKKARNIQFVLEPTTLNEVELVDRKKSSAKSLLKVANVEWVSGAELQKAA